MSIAFVLGNGISRQGIPLDLLKTVGNIYGCNALFRDFTPDVLVATDKPIAMHIEETGYPKTNTFYTRKPTQGSGALELPEFCYAFSSGPAAVALAAQERFRKIYLLGFDMGPTQDQKFNNLYASTEYYKDAGTVPTYTGNWIRQIKKICEEFPATKFVRVCGLTTARVQELDSINNLEHLPLGRFQKRLNKEEDF